MKRFYLFMFALVCTMVAWADGVATVDGIRNGYIYTIRSTSYAITWDGTSANCVGAALDADNPNHQFVAIKVAGSDDCFYFYNVGAGKFFGKSGAEVSLTEYREVYWKMKASGNEIWPLKIDAQDGNHVGYDGNHGEITVSSESESNFQLTEVGAADEALLADIAAKPCGIRNGYIYTIRSSRNAITWDGTSANCVGAALDASNLNHQFVAVKVAGFTDRFYFYNVGAGKFMGKNGNQASLTDSCEVYWKIKASGNEAWPLMLDAQDGNHFNFGGSGQIEINSWSTVDAGNSLQIAEVGVADGSLQTAISMKVYGIKDGYIYTIRSARNAITWDGTSSNCAGAALDASNPNHQFMAIKVAGSDNRFYFYNIGSGKFMSKSGNQPSLTESCEVYWELKASGNESWPFMIDAQDGGHFNIRGSLWGGAIDIGSWSALDAGNSVQITEVGAADEALFATVAINASIREGYVYTINSARYAITWDGTSSNCAGAALDASNPNHQFMAIKVAGSDNRFYFYNVGAGKFLGKSETKASLTESGEVYWTIKASGNKAWPWMIDAQDGNHFNIRSSGLITIDSWNTIDAGNSMQITEVGAADENLLPTVAINSSIRDGYIYTINSSRNAITWDGTSANCVAATLDADNPNHQFVAIKVSGSTDRFYFYNVGAGKFMSKSGTAASLTDSCDVYWTIKANGNKAWPWMIDAQDGNHFNFGGSGQIEINSWNTIDAGNSMQITEVGAADENVLIAIAMKVHGIRDGYIYTINSSRNAITWDGTSANCVCDTLDTDNPNHQFVAIKVAGFSDRFYFYNVGAGKFMGTSGAEASLTEYRETYWRIKASGNKAWPFMIDAQDGSHVRVNVIGEITINNSLTEYAETFKITEVGAADEALLADIAAKPCGIRNGYIYTIRSSRNAITWDGTSANCVGAALDASNLNHQFVAVKVAGFTDRFYFYNIGSGKFMGKNGNQASLTDSCEVYWKIKASGDETWPLMIDAQDGNHFNFGGSGQITIDSWSTVDAGNSLQISEVGVADDSLQTAISMKVYGIKDGYIYTIRSARNAITWDGISANCVADTLDADNPNHRFVAIRVADSDDRFYFYNVGAGKFMSKSGTAASLTDSSEVYWRIKASGNESWPFMIEAQDGTTFNFDGQVQINIADWDHVDAGNSLQIAEVGVADEALRSTLVAKIIADIQQEYLRWKETISIGSGFGQYTVDSEALASAESALSAATDVATALAARDRCKAAYTLNGLVVGRYYRIKNTAQGLYLGLDGYTLDMKHRAVTDETTCDNDPALVWKYEQDGDMYYMKNVYAGLYPQRIPYGPAYTAKVGTYKGYPFTYKLYANPTEAEDAQWNLFFAGSQMNCEDDTNNLGNVNRWFAENAHYYIYEVEAPLDDFASMCTDWYKANPKADETVPAKIELDANADVIFSPTEFAAPKIINNLIDNINLAAEDATQEAIRQMYEAMSRRSVIQIYEDAVASHGSLLSAAYTARAEWGTIILPVNFYSWRPNPVGWTLYTCAATDGNVLTLDEATAGIVQNIPYIVHVDEARIGTTYQFIGYSKGAATTNQTVGLLTGVLEDGAKVPAGSYILSKYNDKMGFYRVAEGTSYDAAKNKCYLTLPDAAARYAALFFEGDTETGIDGISDTEAKQGNGVIYNMSGQRMNKMQKGLNIVNGKIILK